MLRYILPVGTLMRSREALEPCAGSATSAHAASEAAAAEASSTAEGTSPASEDDRASATASPVILIV